MPYGDARPRQGYEVCRVGHGGQVNNARAWFVVFHEVYRPGLFPYGTSKMPESKFNYATGAISNDAFTACGVVNLCKDLSAVNRKNHHCTTFKGVPYVYRVALTLYQQTVAGGGVGMSAGDDTTQMTSTLKLKTAPNTWVHRNAAVKLHKGREEMYKNAGVTKKDRGAYDRTIRYNWDEDDSASSWLTPTDGDAAAYTGGNWETTLIAAADDASISIALVGESTNDEEDSTTFNRISLPEAYLASRNQVRADSNNDVTDQPAANSVLNALFMPHLGASTVDDNIRDISRDNQDQPPYDLAEDGDATEPVEAARCIVGAGFGASNTVVFDAPFGMFEVLARHWDQADTNITTSIVFKVDVLDIYPM